MSTKAGKDAIVFAEYRLLNALARDPEYRLDSRVHEELFVHEIAKSIYRAIDKLDRDSIPITSASLFQASNEIDFNVNLSVIDLIFSVDEEGARSLEDILVVMEEAKRKQILSEKLRVLEKLANSPGPLNAEDFTQGLYEVETVAKTAERRTILKSFDKWSDEYIEELKERAKGKRYTYGDDYLDSQIIKGAYPGAITTIAAGTGQGKSTYVLNLISRLIDTHVPCMYVSLEMSGMDTYDRLIAKRQNIPLIDLYAGDESLHSIIKLVEEEKRNLSLNHKFYFVEEPNLSIAQLRSLIKEFKQRSKSDYILIAIDLVTQLKDFMASAGNSSVANSMERGMNELNSLAKEQNVHFIAVVQFNRDADNYKVQAIEDLELLRPGLNHIKNSHAISERSRVVLSLFRKKFYADRYLTHVPEVETMLDILEIQVLKNSSGAVGSIFNYLFEGERFTVTPFVEDEVGDY